MALIPDIALRILLSFLGHGLALGSIAVPSIRSQISRSFTFEIRAGTRVARHWRFDAPSRRISTHAGPAKVVDHGLVYASSARALRALISPRAVDLIVHDVLHGKAQLLGSAFVLLWFYGLTRKLIAIGREQGPKTAIPGAYLAPDPGSTGAEKIVVLPAVNELDPKWSNAWNARAKLWVIRAATGEPMPEP